MTRSGVPCTALQHVPLDKETSFRIGGKAQEFYCPESVGDLGVLMAELKDRRPFLLGGGCNTLFPDGLFDRPILSTAKMKRLEVRPGNLLWAECGVRIGSLIGKAIETGLSGLERFVGIPGTVGGAVAMNAGGIGVSFGDLVREIGVVSTETGETTCLPGDAVPWGYRSWNLGGYAVAWALLELEPACMKDLRRQARNYFHAKRSTQPLGQPSAGCIFKNPPGQAAASLIDRLGLKGLRHGGAEVSERHANFIVNRQGAASARDVRQLIQEIQGRVKAAYDVELETEVVLADEAETDRRSPKVTDC